MVKSCKRIQFITDSRDKETKSKLLNLDNKLKKSGVKIINESGISSPTFTFENKTTRQWRKSYVISKEGNKTWNDVYKKVNKIYAPKYESVNC